MKVKFDADDNLPLHKTIEIPIITIVVRAVFHEKKKKQILSTSFFKRMSA